MSKIFVVGLSKTGTTSVTDALDILGFKCIHNPEDMLTINQGELEIQLDLVNNYDVLSDLPVAYFFKELDKAYPEAKFILTTRNAEKWADSCANHFDPIVFKPNAHVKKLFTSVYKSDEFDREQFIKAYNEHDNAVISYFADKPGKLSVIDVNDENKWEKLCAFVNRPVPRVPYPHSNTASKIPAPLKKALRKIKNLFS